MFPSISIICRWWGEGNRFFDKLMGVQRTLLSLGFGGVGAFPEKPDGEWTGIIGNNIRK